MGIGMDAKGPCRLQETLQKSPGSCITDYFFYALGETQAVAESRGICITVQCLWREGSAGSFPQEIC